MTNYVIWLSVDPVNQKIDYYPKSIAQRIETVYQSWSHNNNEFCKLGSDFFNATINFTPPNNFCQTTPGLSMGRAGFKQPGFRSVLRKNLSMEEINSQITIYTKFVNGELRLTKQEKNSEKTFNLTVPLDVIIDLNDSSYEDLTYWKPEDLNSNTNDSKNVVVWQWCRTTQEKHYNLLNLDNEWWMPYLYEQNKTIEENFINCKLSSKIILPFDNTEREIVFNNDSVNEIMSCYAKQLRYENQFLVGVRVIRRKIITVGELKYLLNNINNTNLTIQEIIYKLEQNNDLEIPNEFYCCISQSIMKDPVKTIDNHTYDREYIQKWLEHHNTSPLTGLPLASKALAPNTELKNLIIAFVKEKTDKNNTQ